MASPDWEDLSEFFDPDEFAQRAKIYRGDEEIGEVLGLFEDPTAPKELGDFTLDQVGPRFLSPEVGGMAAKSRDELEVNGVKYDIVADAAKDGTGLVVIELAEAGVAHAGI